MSTASFNNLFSFILDCIIWTNFDSKFHKGVDFSDLWNHFSVESLEFMVEPMTTYPLYIDWTPDEPGNFREMVLCHVGGAFRVQAYLLGKCPEPPKPRKVKKKKIHYIHLGGYVIGGVHLFVCLMVCKTWTFFDG